MLYVGSADVEGMYRDPNKDPNDAESYGPGLYWEKRFFSQERNDRNGSPLLIPSDSRCLASPTGKRDYAFYCDGGLSWTVPYVAGLYALACQVNPSVSPASFMNAVKETGDETVLFKNGQDFRFGKIVNPVGLIRKLGGEVD